MNVLIALRELLLTDATVQTVAGSRVFRDVSDRGDAYPNVILVQEGGREDRNLDGELDLGFADVRVDIWHREPEAGGVAVDEEIDQLRRAITALFGPYSGAHTDADGTTNLLEVNLNDEPVDYTTNPIVIEPGELLSGLRFEVIYNED